MDQIYGTLFGETQLSILSFELTYSIFLFLKCSELGKELVDKDTRQHDGNDVRPPLPVKRDVLYDYSMLLG